MFIQGLTVRVQHWELFPDSWVLTITDCETNSIVEMWFESKKLMEQEIDKISSAAKAAVLNYLVNQNLAFKNASNKGTPWDRT